ncbi:EamA family transporter [Alphaproteobacteria bacterium GH1-50]|uniref:EamA family transporter n=2 Tax=Kangsaoukella pontilimi TaxID=2691042 RepID=A0A7C9IU61_9RHOB|nr:EamA family transporter [Kangsaoukella pontilimi]
MLAFAMLVAGSFSFGGRIANQIDPMALTALRFALATLVLGAVSWATGQIERKLFAGWWRYLLLGSLFGAYFVLMFEGLKTAPPVSTAAVFTLTPLMAAGFGYLVMRQVLTPAMAVALVIGGAGALWVIFRGDLSALLAFEIGRGEAIYFWGCLAHALYIPLVAKLSRGEGVFAFAAGTAAGGAVLVGLLGFRQIVSTDWAALPATVWATLAYLVIFASAASISLIQFASRRLKAAKVMAYTYLVPSFVILWELVLTGGLPPALVLPGVALTVLALMLLLREGRAQAA